VQTALYSPSNWLHWTVRRICPFLPGLIGFSAVVGFQPLRSSNIRWIQGDDPLQVYLGWTFFRHGPWTIPPGANPSFGLEKLGSSIFFSDSIPLLALAFKPLAPFLPEPFQYLGFWLVACFLLQSYFAWRLLTIATNDVIARMFGALLFVFAPPMMMRVGVHFSLAGQWVLLAALSFYVSPPRRPIVTWAALCAVSALIHPYLLVMAAVLWGASWAARWMSHSHSPRVLAAESLVVIGSSAIALWAAGAFVMQGGLSLEFGYYRMNLNTLLNPRVDASSVWSYVFPDLGGVSPGEYEGFNFLGLGLAVALALAAGLLVARRNRAARAMKREWVPLGVACVVLTIVAASNEVSMGSRILFRYDLPDRLLAVMGALHGSGRLFWPVFYVMVFASIAQIMRSVRRRVAVPLLGILVLLQIVDTSAGWRPRHDFLNVRPGRTLPLPLHDPFWSQAGTVYRTVRIVRWRSLREHWAAFAVYADRYRMSTEAAYLVRVDNALLESVESRQVDQIERAEFEPTSLYILDDGLATTISERINRRVDLLERFDGFWVLAPRWNALPAPSSQAR
jgi:hypothetical protein